MPSCTGKGDRAALRHAAVLWSMLSVAVLHAPVTAAQGVSHLDLTLGADYRRAQLDWNIAGDIAGNNPNVLSELIWRDMEIAQLSAAVQANLGVHLVLQGSGAYGYIMNSNNQDSDYLGDNRSIEFSRSLNKGAGNISDASLALGYRFSVFDDSVGRFAQIIPMAGYSDHRQNLRIKDGTQVIPVSAEGPIPGLDTTYDAEWKGPWLGLNMRLEASERTAILIDLAYHWADYTAVADWNLRSDLAHPVSFRHDSTGTGIVTVVALAHRLGSHWELLARLESQHWTGKTGVDTTYDTSTGSIVADITHLNVVHWRSRVAGLAATYHF